MLARYLLQVPKSLSNNFFFATVAKDQVNYYKILEVQSGATELAIRKAYADITSGLRPELDPKRFSLLSQAFVILTDSKTRDAYDSLLKVRKAYYLSPEQQKAVTTKSFLSMRRDNKLEQLKKKMNIDQFGRYKGGLPKRSGTLRGSSQAEVGVMHRLQEVQETLDSFPEFHNVTAEKAESFKNFHQDERQARQMKWPWFSFEVDYGYLTFRTFRTKWWPKIQFFILVFYIIPIIYYAIEKFQKIQSIKQLRAKALKNAEPKSEPAEQHHA